MPTDDATGKSGKKTPPENPSQQFQARVGKLFSDMKRVEDEPMSEEKSPAPRNPENQALQRELERLHARIRDLEARLEESELRAATTGKGVEIVYEKENVGYAFQNERLLPIQAANIEPTMLENALQSPIIASGQIIGEVKVKTPQNTEEDWSFDEQHLTNSVAEQVALQVQNLRLLAAAERARAEAQAATRQFSHQSWQNFLDAINQREQIGFAYNQNEIQMTTSSTVDGMDYEATVSVLDQQVGRLYLKSDPQNPLTDEDKALANAVAQQIAQQVENLRLLADAARARAESEEATRRLSRDSWKDYVERTQDTLTFLYDSSRVSAVEDELPVTLTNSHPLVVRGQAIGQLAVANTELDSEAQLIMASIARQASIHLETLRLNEELQKRAQELQELDRLKSSFLANMSHELRTPLNSILGFSDVMLEGIDGPLTEYMENDLRLIQKNGQHLLHLINDVLDMAKIESGRMNLHPEKFKVYELMNDVFKITSSLANSKGINLFVEPESSREQEIYADNTRMRQVMINLVNNAIKFTEQGSISIHYYKSQEDMLLIRVKDTGLGIPADHLEKIFQEFSQVDTSTTRKVGGTGLGLPISRRLIEMHGGRLWAESDGIPGQGSRFYIEIPIIARITEPIEVRSR